MVNSVGTNEFTKILTDNCLQNISYSESYLNSKTDFESVIFGIFFMEPTGVY